MLLAWTVGSLLQLASSFHDPTVAREARARALPALQALYETIETPPVLTVPVYALATVDEAGETNMNIVTYATPVGIRPQRKWSISLFRKTQSADNFLRARTGVLQLLCKEHAPLVYLLGGQSARDVDKRQGCADLGFEWSSSDGHGAERLLPGCASYLRLSMEGEAQDAGDHAVALCRLEEIFAAAGGTSSHMLLTDFLRAEGIITDKGRAVAPEESEISESP